VIVREIFDRYAGGESCQKIAADLNACSVRGPRGGTWCVSALYGSPAKGSGILNNELYSGRYVWNRSRWVRDPDTKKRERLMRPPTEWMTDERPELRIVSDDVWRAVRTRMTGTRAAGGRAGRGGVPTTLFGGLLRCGLCGGAVVKISATAYGYAARRDRGPAVCTGTSASSRDVDRILLAHVQEALHAPATLAALERQTAAILADRSRQGGGRSELRARVTELEAEARRIANALAAVGASPALVERMRETEAQVERAKRALATAPVATLPSAAKAAARAVVDDLARTLRADLPAARDALRATLGDIRLQPEGDGVFAVFEDTADRLVLRAVGDGMGRVAGTGFEPVTFGL